MIWEGKSYKNLFTYSLIKTLYNQNKSFLETFFPFVIHWIWNETLNITKLQENIVSKFWLLIPIFTLKDIVSKLKKLSLIDEIEDVLQNTIKWKEKFKDYVQENISTFGKIEKLLNKIIHFIELEIQIKIDNKETYFTLNQIIEENFINFVDTFSNWEKEVHFNNDKRKETRNLVEKYIVEIFKNKTEDLEILQDIIHWALLSSLLSMKDVRDNISAKFDDLVVYLDTNIIFSALWYHWEYLEYSHKELIKLMIQSWISVKIFEFTIDEAVTNINLYSKLESQYIKWWEVKSIYQFFKDNNWTDADILKICHHFEDKLKSIWISIATLNPKKLKYDEGDYSIDEFKLKPKGSKLHDIFALEWIKFLREWNKL